MSRRRQPKKSKKPKKRGPASVEWVGGLRSMPFSVTGDDGGEFRPEAAIWVQRPPGIIAGLRMAEPEEEGVLAAVLAEALAKASAKPRRIRVATQSDAAEVREQIGPGIPIVVAPTPEIDAVVAEMGQALGGGRPTTFFTSPQVTPELIERFFVACGLLWASAPWRYARDFQVVRVDAPEIGVDGACLSILGAGGTEFGFALFDSLRDFDAFMAVAATRPDPRDGVDLGASELLLSFDDERDVAKDMVREARSLGLKIPSKGAFPTAARVLRNATWTAATARELELLTAVATGLARLVDGHRALFEQGEGPDARETVTLDGGYEVTLTAPYEALDGDAAPRPADAPEAAAPMAKVGRNDPCPCGSGKKYKRCCLGAEAAARPVRARVHDFEATFFDDVMSFGLEIFGREEFVKVAEELKHAGELFMTWMAYVHQVEGQTIAERYAAEVRLSVRERAFFRAAAEAWMSVWEVVDVEPGRSLTLVDLLSGEERQVIEGSASRSLRKRDALMGRVLELDGECVLHGMHPRSLPPLAAAEVVARVRKRLRRKKEVPVDRLRGSKVAHLLLMEWEEGCEELDMRAKIPPRLTNTEGHELVMVTDRFEYEPAAHDWLLGRLERIEHLHVERSSSSSAEITFHMLGNPKIASWDNTIIGQARLSEGLLKLDTNSVERADRLVARILEVAGDIVQQGPRSFSDPMAEPNLAAVRRAGPGGGAPTDGPPPPELLAAIADHKARHYATWPDHPLPPFGGATPREHVKTKEGRRAVELLLKDMEHMEQSDPATAYDMDLIRRELGLIE